VRDLHDLVRVPATVPAVLAEPWREWSACRRVTDPDDLAERALRAAVTWWNVERSPR
jgi:hypothetical protein